MAESEPRLEEGGNEEPPALPPRLRVMLEAAANKPDALTPAHSPRVAEAAAAAAAGGVALRSGELAFTRVAAGSRAHSEAHSEEENREVQPGVRGTKRWVQKKSLPLPRVSMQRMAAGKGRRKLPFCAALPGIKPP